MLQKDASLRSRIVHESKNLGFSLVGIAPVENSPHFDFFSRWLSEGCHGSMAYLKRQAPKRRHPRSVFPEAESLLILGMNYYTRDESASTPLNGTVSRYALGLDYHAVVGERLSELLQVIQKLEPAVRGRCYVDTGPLMEKPWGARAGLGWIGKHTNLISRQLGSWFFVGVILLNVSLDPDSQAENHCGICRRCLDACPTGAIVAPYHLDARLCVSYLTIEHRGLIPMHLRPSIGDRIFGCDDCQDACPWNRFSRETQERSFFPREGNSKPDLFPLVRITREEFEARFKNSPIYRATRDGLARNAVIALGNSKKPEAIPVLKEALRDRSSIVRASAIWAISNISSDDAREEVSRIRKGEQDPIVLQEMDNLF